MIGYPQYFIMTNTIIRHAQHEAGCQVTVLTGLFPEISTIYRKSCPRLRFIAAQDPQTHLESGRESDQKLSPTHALPLIQRACLDCFKELESDQISSNKLSGRKRPAAGKTEGSNKQSREFLSPERRVLELVFDYLGSRSSSTLSVENTRGDDNPRLHRAGRAGARQ